MCKGIQNTEGVCRYNQILLLLPNNHGYNLLEVLRDTSLKTRSWFYKKPSDSSSIKKEFITRKNGR